MRKYLDKKKKLKPLTELISELDVVFNSNLTFYFQFKKDFEASAKQKTEVWNSDWTTYTDLIEKNMVLLNSILILRRNREYNSALSSLRAAFENMLFYRLYINGKKAYAYRIYNIKPEKNENPIARDITLKKWLIELKRWKDTKDNALKNYENTVEITKMYKDKIMIKLYLEGVYEINDTEKKRHWMTYYQMIFHEYDPINRFTGDLPTIKENMMFPEIVEEKTKINKILYDRHFNFEKGLLAAWELNGFVNQIQKDIVRVHYNFLSLFVHPNKYQNSILAYEIDYNNTKLPQIKEDKVIELLITLYIIKIQEILLNTIFDRLSGICKISSFEDFSNQLKINCSLADLLWFIYDEPTDKDKEFFNTMKVFNKSTKKTVGYYDNPLERLKKVFGYR
ncbi:MAG: hypothetical protein V1859_02455 [archaeon]